MAQRTGVITTSNQSTEGRAVRDVSSIVNNLEPNKYPLVVFLNQIEGRKKVTGNFKFEWLEDTVLPRYDVLGGALTADAATMTVTNYARFIKNMLVRINKSEIVRVTATPSTTSVAIDRAAGETSATTASSGEQLHILGMAFEEGSSIGDILSTIKTNPYNYTQIFRTLFGRTGTAEASKVYGETDKKYDRAKAIVEHAKDIENSFIMGERASSTSGGVDSKALRLTRGALAWISTNAQDAGGTLTEPEFDEWLRKSFRYGSASKLGIFSSKMCAVVNGFAKQKLQVSVTGKKYGMDLTTYIFSGGKKVDFISHPLFENAVNTDFSGLAGTGLILYVSDMALRYMEGRYMRHDMDIVKAGTDAEQEQILSECGLELQQESKHSELTGVES